MRAHTVERVLTFGRAEKFGQPAVALIDARLVLPGHGAGAAGAVLGAIAGAGGADLGSDRGLQGVDAGLES